MPGSVKVPFGKRRAFLVALAVAIGGVLAGGLRTTPARAGAAPGQQQVRGDFNGDGYPDLAVGIPSGDGGLGAVTVLYGSASGLTTARSQYWTLSTSGLAGKRGAVGDLFGAALATGDFSGTGFADLAISVPGRSGVVVLYGSGRGIQSAGSQFLPGFGPLGGFSLATGHFMDDRFADLAVGEPFANANKAGAGSVEIHYGSLAGLTGVTRGTAQRFMEGSAGMPGPAPSLNDNFGISLATGYFSGGRFSDLAIGAPNAGAGSGAAIVLRGARGGLTTSGSQYLPSFGYRSSGGYALAAGDFNGDGFDDLAVGVPNVKTSADEAGAIEIHYGSTKGLTNIAQGSAQAFAEVSPGMPSPPTATGDKFGYSLAVGDFNGGGFADLAVGVPGKSAAIVLYGSARGITTRNSEFLAGIGPQAGSQLAATGVTLATADFNGDGFADLALGEPFTNTTQAAAGVIEVHHGSASGLVDTSLGSAPVYSESTAGMAGTGAGANDNFGLSLATG